MDLRSDKNIGMLGFSMVEVVIAIGILMAMSIAVSSTLRSGVEIRFALSQKAKVTQRMNNVLAKVSKDLEHAFYVSPKDQLRNGIGRRTKGIFFVKAGSKGDKLALTTATHKSYMAGAKESDMSYVVYDLDDSKESTGRTNLYRGDSGILPEDLNEDPKMELMAKNIKTIKFELWNGEKWTKEGWDTGRSDWRDKIPRLVKITIEAWLEDRIDGDGNDSGMSDELTDKISTVVYIPSAAQFPEIRDQDSSVKWEAF